MSNRNRIKQWAIGSVLGVIVLTAPWSSSALGELVKPTAAHAAENKADRRTIQVNGQGEITVAPDIAYVNLGVFAKASTAHAAQEEVSRTLAKIEKVLYDDYKIAKKDVKTTNFHVHPEYSYEDRKAPVINGYQATHIVTVSYRELGKLGNLLDAVSKAGANRIDSVQFSTEKGEEYQLQAIEKAMSNAEAKAKVIAKYAGKDVKGIVHVNQSGTNGVPIAYSEYAKMAPMAADMGMSAGGAAVAPGELKLSASVNVTFEF